MHTPQENNHNIRRLSTMMVLLSHLTFLPSGERLLIILKCKQSSSKWEGKTSLGFLFWNISWCLWREEEEGFTFTTLGLLHDLRVSATLRRDTLSLASKAVYCSDVPFVQKGWTKPEQEKSNENCLQIAHYKVLIVQLMKLITGIMLY